MRIFVINPGSTSTKFALYIDEKLVWKHTVNHRFHQLKGYEHVNKQLDKRMERMFDAMKEFDIEPRFDAVIARGGLLKPTPGGVYLVDDVMQHDLLNAELEHACNLGGIMAARLAEQCACPAFIADPEVVDELMDEARLSGIPEINRRSVFHALNSKAVSRRYAESLGRRYEDMNLIVAHLGGGISVGAHRHGKVVDVNNALNGDGPFSPERAGTVPADSLVELCFSGKYTKQEIKRMLNGKGGLSGHLKKNNVQEIVEQIENGNEEYRRVVDAMLYTVAKEIGSRHIALRCKTDAIILTGGIAHSKYCIDKISGWIEGLAPIVVRAGEDEMEALAFNAARALDGSFEVQRYRPESHSKKKAFELAEAFA